MMYRNGSIWIALSALQITEMAALTEKNSKFLCTVWKGEQDVGGCTHMYRAIHIYTHHIAIADSYVNLETNAVNAMQLPSIHGSIQV